MQKGIWIFLGRMYVSITAIPIYAIICAGMPTLPHGSMHINTEIANPPTRQTIKIGFRSSALNFLKISSIAHIRVYNKKIHTSPIAIPNKTAAQGRVQYRLNNKNVMDKSQSAASPKPSCHTPHNKPIAMETRMCCFFCLPVCAVVSEI
ncbi:MAG: hypothetical protein K2L96_08340 [Muribaculaceae bacterium]|nr:hypothetical protein [Muribaculaceae bacterium]